MSEPENDPAKYSGAPETPQSIDEITARLEQLAKAIKHPQTPVSRIIAPNRPRPAKPLRTYPHITDRTLLREQAILALTDPWYMSTEILQLQDELPRTRGELEPDMIWLHTPRPSSMHALARWLRFWSSPRFTAKTLNMLVYLFMRALKDVNIRCIIQGQEKANAADSLLLLREWFALPKIEQLYGSFVSKDWGKEEFTISQRNKARRDPTFRALGLDVPQQGKRCDIMAWDDLIGETNNTDEGIRKVERRISSSIPVIRQGGEGLYRCTRWSPYDPSTDGFTISGEPGILKLWKLGELWDAPAPRGWFGAYAQPGDEYMYPHAVPGQPLYPGVLPEESIQEARKSMSLSMFNSQILNNPLPTETRYFDPDDYQHFDPTDENGIQNPILVGSVPFMAVDPNRGGKPRAGADEVAIAVGNIKWEVSANGQSRTALGFLMEWSSGQWLPDKTYQMMMEFMRLYRPRTIFVETNIGGEYFLSSFRQLAREHGFDYLPIREIYQSNTVQGHKKARIEGMQEHYRYRRIWHARKLKNSKGEDQLSRWGPDATSHDDLADVLAIWFLEATRLFVPPQPVHHKGRPGRASTLPPVRYRYTGM